MAANESLTTAKPPLAARLHTAPAIGLLSLLSVLVLTACGHSFLVMLRLAFTGPGQYVVGALVGLAGFALVWIGLRKDELTATFLGLFGGILIWTGWFEYSFQFFGRLLELKPILDMGFPVLPPNLQLMEASSVILLALLVFLGANKNTRCRMFQWFHRNAKLTPGKPTPGHKRGYSRITALEMVSITWFFYVVIILLYDPRILGIMHPVTIASFGVFLVWGLWLTVWRLAPYRDAAQAIRYAIPVAGILWVCVEMGAHWRIYPEFWIQPFRYPLAMSALAACLIAAVAVLNFTSKRGIATSFE